MEDDVCQLICHSDMQVPYFLTFASCWISVLVETGSHWKHAYTSQVVGRGRNLTESENVKLSVLSRSKNLILN